MSIATKSPMARLVKRILDVFRVLAFLSLFGWPLFALAISIGHSSDRPTWGVDISVFSSIDIDLNEFPTATEQSTGIRDPKINGKAILNIDTSSLSAFYVFALTTEFAGMIGLYMLLQLRAVFASLAEGNNFAVQNSIRIMKIGYVAIGWALISPLLQYFSGKKILSEYSLNLPGIELRPAFELDTAMIFIGLAMMVLSGILKEAADIHENQQLTI